MKVKKYIAETKQDAMLKIKVDLGLDAVILHQKKFKQGGIFGLFGKEMWEVVAAVDDSLATRPAAATATATVSPIPPKQVIPEKPSKAENNVDIEELQQEISNMKEMLKEIMSQGKMPATESAVDKEVLPENFEKVCQALIKNEVDPGLARRMLHIAAARFGKLVAQEQIEGFLIDYVSRLVRTTGPIETMEDGPKVIALVGPTGVGKTTTLAKLAADFVLARKKKVALITADTYRIAAVKQLETYGEIIGVPVDVVYSPQELSVAIKKHANKDVVLIDTAGRSQRNKEQMKELEGFMKVGQPHEIHLVLSLATKVKDLFNVVENFSCIPLDKFIFTKLDETTTYGNILNLLTKFDRPISYITFGQNVPDDIEIANTQKLARMVVKGLEENERPS